MYTFLRSIWCWLPASAPGWVSQSCDAALSLTVFSKPRASDCQEKQRGKSCEYNPARPVSVLMSKIVGENSTELVFSVGFQDSHPTSRLPEGAVLGRLCCAVRVLFWRALCTDFELEGDVLKQLISVCASSRGKVREIFLVEQQIRN